MLLPADPRANYLAHKIDIDAAVQRVLEKGWYILGPEVAAFEQEFARYYEANHSVAVNSGTDALHLALRACDVGPGDGVITVSHTAVATVAAVELAGATPVLVDIDPRTFTMDPNRLLDVLQRGCEGPIDFKGKLKAVIPVHLYGHPADMPAILEISQRYGLMVIEDCAQAHGAALQGRKAGAWGPVAAFSFYPTKNLGALGDGGAVVFHRSELAEKARLLREYGWRERYVSELAGMNTRLDELQAAILRVKLTYLNQENARRRELAGLYDSLLAGTSIIRPHIRDGVDHVYHQYVVRTAKRDALRQYLADHQVGTAIHYPVPVHQQPAYRSRAVLVRGGLPNTDQVCGEILSLPMHAQLTDEVVKSVGDLIVAWDR
jgi:dTDP-4-amino-4,6-dideoxygalactose transaminase